ncbi:hypothetical protein [Microtetraspora sp. NBRC 16547]|uniref:hypothetical protein n=1 Tax=Microtetraspora sp. NBRC 16547 TaxID=3030993 RepID=UPI002555B596|nr:hypothetical protein [Microtetraspora sp. NBRC 16547]
MAIEESERVERRATAHEVQLTCDRRERPSACVHWTGTVTGLRLNDYPRRADHGGVIMMPRKTHLNLSVTPGGVQTDGQTIKGLTAVSSDQALDLHLSGRGGGI